MLKAEEIYSWAKDLPIVDWHNHLDLKAIAEDRPFGSLYEVWVKPDPYKHRAMRICGVPERLITGEGHDLSGPTGVSPVGELAKWNAWMRTLPKLVGTPLFSWARMELESLGLDPIPYLHGQGENVSLSAWTPSRLLSSFNVEWMSPCVGVAHLGPRASRPLGCGWTAAAVREFSCACADTEGHYSPTLAAGASHRRNYPHIGQNSTLMCVTFRLADSLPDVQLAELEERKRDWLMRHPEPWDEVTFCEWRSVVRDQVDKWLDAGHGSCILADVRCRRVVEEALEFFDANREGHAGPTGVPPVGRCSDVRDGQDARSPSGTGPTGVPPVGGPRYRLHSYVVMPNHVHVLLELFSAGSLARIIQSWKSFTAKKLNDLLGRSGKVWHDEYFDRLIRNAEHYGNVIRYIRKNGEAAKALARMHANGLTACNGRDARCPRVDGLSANGQDARCPRETGPTGVSPVGRRVVPSLRMNAGERISANALERFHAEGCRIVDVSVDDEDSLEREFDSLSAVAGFAAAHDWTMLLHLGALRETSARLRVVAGPAGGYAGMRAAVDPNKVARFLNRLERNGQDARCPSGLPRTILLTLNPEAHAQLAVLAGSFVEDGVPGKVQLGPAWWWCDHREGIFDVFEKNAAYGVLSTFVGMTTDSRSFLSFVRHDYFRRLLARWLAQKVADGDFPDDEALLRPLVENICYRNAKEMVS